MLRGRYRVKSVRVWERCLLEDWGSLVGFYILCMWYNLEFLIFGSLGEGIEFFLYLLYQLYDCFQDFFSEEKVLVQEWRGDVSGFRREEFGLQYQVSFLVSRGQCSGVILGIRDLLGFWGQLCYFLSCRFFSCNMEGESLRQQWWRCIA